MCKDGYSTCREVFGEGAGFLEELLKVRLAVEDAIHGRVVAHLTIYNYIYS